MTQEARQRLAILFADFLMRFIPSVEMTILV